MKPKCKLIGENDNVFNLITLTRKALREHGEQYLIDSFEKVSGRYKGMAAPTMMF